MSFSTRVLQADARGAVAEAAGLLKAGQVVGIPTETVYGLAANALNGDAVRRIFEAKGRPQDNPLIVHVAATETVQEVAAVVPKAAYALAEAYWPGPLTMVLPRGGSVAPQVSAGLATVAIRMPSHPVALALIRAAGLPLAAPSANLSGRPSPTSAQHVLQDMDGRIPLILDGGPCRVGVESTVISLVEEPVLLRPGYVTAEQLQEVLGRPVVLAKAIDHPLAPDESPASPGLKHRHYAPRAEVILVKGDLAAFAALAARQAGPGVGFLCFEGEEALLPPTAVAYGPIDEPERQAAALFSALRKLDELELKRVFARAPMRRGVGLAVYNRLLRAANFNVIHA